MCVLGLFSWKRNKADSLLDFCLLGFCVFGFFVDFVSFSPLLQSSSIQPEDQVELCIIIHLQINPPCAAVQAKLSPGFTAASLSQEEMAKKWPVVIKYLINNRKLLF